MDLIIFASAVWNKLTKAEFQDPVATLINSKIEEFSARIDIEDVTLPSPLPSK